MPKVRWNVPLSLGRSHIFLEWMNTHNILYTYFEPIKPHRNFFQPSTNKLHNFLIQARSWETSTITWQFLEDHQSAPNFPQQQN